MQEKEIIEKYDSTLIRKLKRLGYRITGARLKIIGCIESMKHFDLEQISELHQKEYGEDLNHQSLYNIINLLVELDVAKKRHNRETGTYYEIIEDSHVHIYSNNDAKRTHFDKQQELIEDVKSLLTDKYDVKVDRIDLEIRVK